KPGTLKPGTFAGKKAPEVDESKASDNGRKDDQVTKISTARSSFVNAASQTPINAAGPFASTNAYE
nr:hypothetical protein [Tanacetum cinerariifolium]